MIYVTACLASGTRRCEKASLWDTTTWEELASFKGQNEIVFSLFSPDGDKLALCDLSGGVRLLCAPSFQEIQAQEAKRSRWR
jgi:WD40 repeat protein